MLIYPGAGADGIVGDQFVVSPPLVVTRADIDAIVDRIALALGDLARELAVRPSRARGGRPRSPRTR